MFSEYIFYQRYLLFSAQIRSTGVNPWYLSNVKVFKRFSTERRSVVKRRKFPNRLMQTFVRVNKRGKREPMRYV